MKAPPIYCWKEPIDAVYMAVIVRCYAIKSGCIYGMSVFLLCENTEHNRAFFDRIGRQRFNHVLAEQHGGHLPYCGSLRYSGREFGLA